MFLKSFTSNIVANYEVSKQPSAQSGVWQIFPAKKKSTSTPVSIFKFDRKVLEVRSDGFGARSSATSVRKAQEEVVERLKKEASSLARLRHPSILQLVEPVEETRSGGLMFATEPVTASLGGLLLKRDLQERETNGRERSKRSASQNETVGSQCDEVDLDEFRDSEGSATDCKRSGVST